MTTSPVEFAPLSEEFFNDPTEMYRRLRDEAPGYYIEKYGLSLCRASPTSWRLQNHPASRADQAS